ncbi:hypothetical protein COBT_001945 [Conglomerata obtusa]
MTLENLHNPFIVQCKSCNIIISDSFALVDYKHNHLIFTTINNDVTTKKLRHTSKKNFDIHCSYSDVHCKCEKNIGKFYYTVNRECSTFVGRYCVNREEVKSYVLGSVVNGKEMGISDLCEEVEKLQRFCVYLHKKIND